MLPHWQAFLGRKYGGVRIPVTAALPVAVPVLLLNEAGDGKSELDGPWYNDEWYYLSGMPSLMPIDVVEALEAHPLPGAGPYSTEDVD